jgi:hypothetical protein
VLGVLLRRYGAMEWVVNEKNGGGRTVAVRTINCLKVRAPEL